jgi:FAD/FMN-containing dehydrogenase
MAVIYAAALRTRRLNIIVNALGSAGTPTIDTTGVSAGSLVIGTSALSGATGVLATITLSTTPATVTDDVLTISGVPLSTTASATGTAAKAELRDNAGTVIVSGLTVGTSGTDIIISNTSVTSGQTVQVTSGTLTHPST